MSESNMALMTVEITVSDSGDGKSGFAIGGRRPMADEVQKALAAHLGVEEPPEGRLLRLTLTKDEVSPILDWVQEHFPSCGYISLDEKPASLLLSAPASPAAPVSPWRAFDLKIHNEVPVNEELVPSVAALVDILHQQVTSWFLDPMKPIFALVQNYNPVLRVQVVPEVRLVYVDHLSAER